MEDVELDLCKEVVKAMRTLGFEEASISSIASDPKMREAEGKHPGIQRSLLTMMFYNKTMYTGNVIPTNIRLAMTVAPSPTGWIQDIISTVLPFMKVNESVFFC